MMAASYRRVPSQVKSWLKRFMSDQKPKAMTPAENICSCPFRLMLETSIGVLQPAVTGREMTLISSGQAIQNKTLIRTPISSGQRISGQDTDQDTNQFRTKDIRTRH